MSRDYKDSTPIIRALNSELLSKARRKDQPQEQVKLVANNLATLRQKISENTIDIMAFTGHPVERTLPDVREPPVLVRKTRGNVSDEGEEQTEPSHKKRRERPPLDPVVKRQRIQEAEPAAPRGRGRPKKGQGVPKQAPESERHNPPRSTRSQQSVTGQELPERPKRKAPANLRGRHRILSVSTGEEDSKFSPGDTPNLQAKVQQLEAQVEKFKENCRAAEAQLGEANKELSHARRRGASLQSSSDQNLKNDLERTLESKEELAKISAEFEREAKDLRGEVVRLQQKPNRGSS